MRIKMLVFCMSVLMLLPAGCAKKTETVHVHYYPSCYEPLGYLHQRKGENTGKAVAAGAIQGGILSGIATAIAGAITGNLRPVGMLAGVAAGGVVGGVVGGVNQHNVSEKEDNQHLSKYLEEIDGDISNMDIVTAAATVSRQCYAKEFNILLKNMREGKLDKNAAVARYTEIETGTKEADQLLGVTPDLPAMQSEFNAASTF